MGLWGGVPDILQSTYCNLPGISDILKTVPDLLQNGVLGDVTEGTVNLLSLNTIDGILKNGNNNGLLGTLGVKKPDATTKNPNSNTQQKPPNYLLNGLLG